MISSKPFPIRDRKINTAEISGKRQSIWRHTVIFLILCFSLWAGAAEEKTAAAKTNAFFAFCIDTHDAKKRDLAQQAQMLKDLGYDGVGHLWLDNLPERLKTLDAVGLKLYQISLLVDLAPGKPAFDPRLKELMPLLKERGVQLALLMKGLKPSDAAGDSRALEVVNEIADLARPYGAQVVLYPHTDFWLETIQDALRLARKVDRPDVGVMFNLCHWLRVSKDRDYRPLLTQAMPRLLAFSVNGADEDDPKPGWGHYIQPLGRGSFDVFRLLQTLHQLGYTGPIGLQCYGIPGDARDHLDESLRAWRTYQAHLAATGR
jgi:sugar phosphate isomerase/epimerase